MLNIGYSRLGIGVYVAHTDILRGLNKVFRRAGLDIEYTNGMSKHMDLRMSPPLPLGIETAEEWVAAKIDTNLSEPEIIDLFNKNAPEFLKAKTTPKTAAIAIMLTMNKLAKPRFFKCFPPNVFLSF